MDGDLDDELLALAGDSNGRQRKKKQPGAVKLPKKRKQDDNSESEDDVESEEDDSNPYPLEGKYIDEADRLRLLGMSEIAREDILANRLEEMQKRRDRQNLEKMVKLQNGVADADSPMKSAKRARGPTKEKSAKLDKYKAERKAKEERKRAKADQPGSPNSPKARDASTQSESEEDEDGQFNKVEEEDQRLQSIFGKQEREIVSSDLNGVRLSRDILTQYCLLPGFEELVKGAYVRVRIDTEGEETKYRICEVVEISAERVKPYKIDSQSDLSLNQQLDLNYAGAVKAWPMNMISNSQFTPIEFTSFVNAYQKKGLKLPVRSHLDKKRTQLQKIMSAPLTDSMINAKMQRKSQLQPSKVAVVAERSRLHQARIVAIGRRDHREVAEIDAEIAKLREAWPQAGDKREREEDANDMLAKVNERNRRANDEAVRRAEAIDHERRRRERRLGTVGQDAGADPSARLKTLPVTFSPRGGTPSTPVMNANGLKAVSPMPALQLDPAATTFDAMISTVQIDIGDF